MEYYLKHLNLFTFCHCIVAESNKHTHILCVLIALLEMNSGSGFWWTWKMGQLYATIWCENKTRSFIPYFFRRKISVKKKQFVSNIAAFQKHKRPLTKSKRIQTFQWSTYGKCFNATYSIEFPITVDIMSIFMI